MEQTKTQLTDENYFSLEADKEFMSVSQYKGFLKCEAQAMAKLNGEWNEPKSDALLFGSYVHAWLDGTIEQFKEENPDLFSSRGATKGQLKATYKNADNMIEVLEGDPFVMFALQGQKEVIMTGELFGHNWKIKVDVYNPELGRFADLKTVKAIRDKHWLKDKSRWGSFVEAYGYITQMAVYSEIEKQNRNADSRLDNYIVAVSKEDIPDKAIITIDQYSLDEELKVIEENIARIGDVKAGLLRPHRCESCAYCRKTKMLNSIVNYQDLIEL